MAAGLEGQRNWLTGNHQQHQYDDENQEHCNQFTNPVLHRGLILNRSIELRSPYRVHVIYLEYITGKIKSLYVIFLAFTGK